MMMHSNQSFNIMHNNIKHSLTVPESYTHLQEVRFIAIVYVSLYDHHQAKY